MRTTPKVITSATEILQWRRQINAPTTVGFVPTMGALHRGHSALLRAIRPRCEISVLSVFVNPMQFAPHEDLDRYPRSFQNDLEIAAEAGVDVVFAPTVHELYPPGFSTFVEESSLSLPFCGPFRPGHFRGVTTIVLKLFNLVRPGLALFGLKDAQQFFILKKMVQDLNLDLKIEGVETVREPDGLALSSRNVFLSPEERERAPLLHKTLLQVRADLMNLPADQNINTLPLILERAIQTLSQNQFKVQYFDCRKLPSFDPLDHYPGREQAIVIATAALLGKTRLIDNLIIS